jgi:RNase H-fold protein (predicted Holliday junction resolvase)
VKEFVSKLKNETDIPVDFVDERFTSAEADRMGGDASRDERAAVLILQSYLDIKN